MNVQSKAGHVLIGVLFLVTNINTFVLAGVLAGCVCVRRAVRGERSLVAVRLSHLIYDLKGEQEDVAEYEKVQCVAGTLLVALEQQA